MKIDKYKDAEEFLEDRVVRYDDVVQMILLMQADIVKQQIETDVNKLPHTYSILSGASICCDKLLEIMDHSMTKHREEENGS